MRAENDVEEGGGCRVFYLVEGEGFVWLACYLGS